MINFLTVQLVCTSDVEIVFFAERKEIEEKKGKLNFCGGQVFLAFSKQNQLKT